MADDAEAERPDQVWTVKLDKVERASSDGLEPDGENLFVVTFATSGPDLDLGMEVMVSDIGDEAQVVTEALDILQDGLETLARVVGRRKGGRADSSGDAVMGGGTMVGLRWFSEAGIISSAKGCSVGIGMI